MLGFILLFMLLRILRGFILFHLFYYSGEKNECLYERIHGESN